MLIFTIVTPITTLLNSLRKNIWVIEVFEEKINIYMKDKTSKQHISDFDGLVKEIENKINSPKT